MKGSPAVIGRLSIYSSTEVFLNQEPISTLLEFSLVVAASENKWQYELGEIHLLKLIYLADLAYARQHEGQTLTGVPWVFHSFGPWDKALHLFLVAQLATGLYRMEQKVSVMGEYTRYVLAEEDEDTIEERFRELDRSLPHEATSAIAWAVHQFGVDTQSLLHYVYGTEPMLRAAPEEPLTFCGLRLGGAAPGGASALPPPPEPPSKTQLRKAEEAKTQSKVRIKALLQERREARQAQVQRVDADPEYLEIMSLLGQEDRMETPQATGLMDIDEGYWKTGIRRLFDVSE